MTLDARLESLYQQIELVRGSGDPKRRQLCVMSFVAFLAGEPHSDRPSTASGVIRRFAIIINDHMPTQQRQSLKSFAPRLIGTNDGHDPERINLLAKAARTEILPRVMSDFRFPMCSCDDSGFSLRLFRKQAVELSALVATVTALAASCNSSSNESLATELANLISHCALLAPNGKGEWYWLKAIDLFDRLSDVAGEEPRATMRIERLASIEDLFLVEAEARQRRARMLSAVARVRNLIPALMR